tara:strand:- start:315 stop:719 length:405 start_codon:yes stop_codon:yes gene_type:complete
MIEALTIAAVKEFFKKVLAWCKKYWQFLAGMFVGIALLLLSRDSSGVKKTIENFKKSSDQERERSLEIDREKSSKVDQAIDKFEEDLKKSAESLIERDEKIEEENDRKVESLLEKEEAERGTIAAEIQKKIDKI